MDVASRTPEGDSNICGVCGNSVTIEPTHPPGDAPCPQCGALLWFDPLTDEVIRQLTVQGASIETEENGQVTSIRLTGAAYDDFSIRHLAKITGVQTLDIRDTKITAAGASKLRSLLPSVLILHGPERD